MVNEMARFALATGAELPDPDGLVVYWNRHRITGFQALPASASQDMLAAQSPLPASDASRLAHGEADGIAVAVSLRRIRQTQTEPLTATFNDLPQEHRNEPFTFQIRFSETLAGAISYRIFAGGNGKPSILSITNGAVTKAKRVESGDNRDRTWAITIEPDGQGDVTIVLPAPPDCTATGALCADSNRALSASVERTIPAFLEQQPVVQEPVHALHRHLQRSPDGA